MSLSKVLMIGWEFPPHKNGGLGVACRGLSNALADCGVEVTFVLPRAQKVDSSLRFVFADLPGAAGRSPSAYTASGSGGGASPPGWSSFLRTLWEYAERVGSLAKLHAHDVIHAHDWLTYLAGIAAKRASGKPLVVHVHNTIYDRGLGSASPEERAIERAGLVEADGVIAVSDYTKQIVVRNYGIPAEKISVVHNGTDPPRAGVAEVPLARLKEAGKRIVLYVGRITVQKGVDHLLEAANVVCAHDPRAVFIIVGDGDMLPHIIHQTTEYGLSDKVLFTGWLSEREVSKLYAAADLFVMPSVSEPFGLVCLEALAHGAPVLLSKQSGAGEVLRHSLKVDFWDTEEMANKILAALAHEPLRNELFANGRRDALRATWQEAARKCIACYDQVVRA